MFVLGLVATAAVSAPASGLGPMVNTTAGVVGGVSSPLSGVDVFWNIPYAAPPLGARRWARPEHPDAWEGVRWETGPGPCCPQLKKGEVIGDEDCLKVNVFRPRDVKGGDNLPVMVWIHGGAFRSGDSTGNGLTDGSALSATQRVVVVTLQYRLQVMGFLALDGLMREQGTAGNWGLLDQQKALEWVQRNAAAFGGDPGRVTIFGESAGGCSVVAQVSMPGSRGLFHAAIAESPVADGNYAWIPFPAAASTGLEWARRVNCTDQAPFLSCLRALPLAAALSSAGAMLGTWWWPAIDGTTLPASPVELAARGEAADVPLMLGTNENEGTIFVTFFGSLLTNSSLDVALGDSFDPSVVQNVLQLYPASSGGAEPFTYTRIGSHIIRDYMFTCAARRFLRAINTGGRRKSAVYMYHFEYDMKGMMHRIQGDYHGSEIPFVFDNKCWMHTSPFGTWGAQDKLMAAEMGSYWGSFARRSNTSSPLESVDCTAKSDGKPTCIEFPPYTVTEAGSGSDAYMVFDTHLHTAAGLFEQRCNFWDTVPPLLPFPNGKA
eukprot:Hpha_TRINITY_DN15648_c1_g14::TRINITY_DN15648_c1_g14_i1::g.99755::m.99755